MPHYPKISGSKCYLSPVCAEDAPLWAGWLNDLAVSLPLGDEAYRPYSLENAQADIAETIRREDHVFTIVDLATGRPIGRCLLFQVDLLNRSAMLGIFIGPEEYRGRGYGSEATRLLLDYAFNLLNLNNVMLGVFAYNRQALACYRKVGFKEIGRRRQARILAEKRYDVILMDILREEFESPVLARYMPDGTREAGE